MGEERRIFEYFVVAGLSSEAEELTPGAIECGYKNSAPQAPITDICIIFPALGEQVPEGFTCIETTPTGYPADLNHGSLRTTSCYLCYRRGFHKPPLVDIGVLYEGKGERVMVDSQILQTTPYGRPANVNNGSQGIYLTYRRASESAPPNLLAVTDVCVILFNKGESAPHTFCRITKNLNKGMIGSEVYLCYKKSHANANRIAYKPTVLNRFPAEDDWDSPLPQKVPIFCLPMGAVIECWPAKCQTPAKLYSTFVLTDDKGRKFYGAAVTFYEAYGEVLTAEQMDRLGLSPETQLKAGSCSDNSSTNDPAEQLTIQCNKAVCVVSRFPFYTAFKRYLFYLHRMSVTGSYSLPIERYISHLMYEVPFPTIRRPRVLVQLGNETISFDNHDDTQLPLSGAAHIDFLKNLGPDNAMYLLLLALLEQKILIHSLRPWLLTSVAEAICSLIFPFHWQCPYIPQCPLDLAGVLHAPLPFIAGVDSRYFELYEDPPRDVTCIDLDTATVSQSEVRRGLKLGILPRRPAKLLRQTLEHLYRRVHQEDWNVTTMRSSREFMPIDLDYKLQKRRYTLESEIQEAFLRFMASILKGYREFLKPIKAAPPKVGSTDTGALFNVDAFLRSRPRDAHDFYKRLQDTQSFIRFIEERSLLSDKNAYMAFFDECVEKVDPSNVDRVELKLLEYESALNSDHTVFIAPPESLVTNEGRRYTYEGFPQELSMELFCLDSLDVTPKQKLLRQTRGRRRSFDASTPAVRRTKQEAKSALKLAKQQSDSPIRWAKCLLSYAYSLWFLQFPAYVKACSSKQKALRTAFSVLDRMHSAHLPLLDELCYRILMQVCDQYGKPLMTVRVFMAMNQQGLKPNAITYGFYNKAVLEADWPSSDALNAEKKWTLLRHVVKAIVVLKKSLKESKKRRTLSQFSQDSGADYVSQTSLLSGQGKELSLPILKTSALDVASVSTETSGDRTELVNDKGAIPDQGYQSQATEDSLSVEQRTNCDDTFNQSQPSQKQAPMQDLAKLTDSQLETFDDIRLRGPVIVSPQSGIPVSILQSYNSPAGLLITTGSSMIADGSMHSRKVSEGRHSFQPVSFQSPLGESGLQTISTSFRPESLGEDAHILQEFQQQQETRNPIDFNVGDSPERLVQIPEALETITVDSNTCSLSEAQPVTSKTNLESLSPSTPVTVNDPLGHFDAEDEKLTTVTSEIKPLIESPSRAQFLEMQKPFEGEEFQPIQEPTASAAGFGVLSKTTMRGLFNKFGLSRSQTTSDVFSGSSPMVKKYSDVEKGNAENLPSSPSISELVNQAQTKMWSKVGDAMQKQHPRIAELRDGITSVMKELKSFKGNIDQLSTPLRGSLSSLTMDIVNYGEDTHEDVQITQQQNVDENQFTKQNYDDGCSYEQWSGPISKVLETDPAFQLSSGKTGNILTYNFVGSHSEGIQPHSPKSAIEVILSTCTRCTSCANTLYDEEILAGWTSEESNLNTQCLFCKKTFVPILAIKQRKYASADHVVPILTSWYNNKQKFSNDHQSNKNLSKPKNIGSCDSLLSWPGSPIKHGVYSSASSINDTKHESNVCRQLFHHPEPVIEDSHEEESDALLTPVADEMDSSVFIDESLHGKEDNVNVCMPVKEDILNVPFLSPLVLRKEMESTLVNDPAAMDNPSFMQSNPILFWNMLYFFHRLSVPTHMVQWIPQSHIECSESISGKSDWLNTEVLVRCVYDNSQLHEESMPKPFYIGAETAVAEDHSSSLVAALLLEQRALKHTLVQQILDYLALPNMVKAIQLLINEHRQSVPLSASPSRSLPRHLSIYRDILFLAILYFGKELRHDQFDKEYADAFAKLPPTVSSMLPAYDQPPSLKVRACRKVFMPLDLV